jgi:hypothetical protein
MLLNLSPPQSFERINKEFFLYFRIRNCASWQSRIVTGMISSSRFEQNKGLMSVPTMFLLK